MKPTDQWASGPVLGWRMSAVDYMLGDLREAIDSGVIHVGERLPSEAALATRYSVSRSVVREVLRACEALGLTVTRGGKGTFVVGTHAADLMFEGYSSTLLNPQLAAVIEVFADVLATIASALGGQSEMLNVQRNRRASSAAEHRTIAAAIARGSAVEAEDAMRYHLGEVREALAVSMTVEP